MRTIAHWEYDSIVQWIPLNIIPPVHECFMTLSGLFYNPGRHFPLNVIFLMQI